MSPWKTQRAFPRGLRVTVHTTSNGRCGKGKNGHRDQERKGALKLGTPLHKEERKGRSLEANSRAQPSAPWQGTQWTSHNTSSSGVIKRPPFPSQRKGLLGPRFQLPRSAMFYWFGRGPHGESLGGKQNPNSCWEGRAARLPIHPATPELAQGQDLPAFSSAHSLSLQPVHGSSPSRQPWQLSE